MQAETGKVRGRRRAGGALPLRRDQLLGRAGRRLPRRRDPDARTIPLFKVKRLRITYRPYPVVGVISPWNFPLILALDDAIPALMAGAAVVIKPSEFTPLIAMEVVRGWKEIGAPDVLEVVNGTAETGGALIDKVDFIQFTGSERTGKIVMKRAADTLTPVSLELGGKDPMIVLRDAEPRARGQRRRLRRPREHRPDLHVDRARLRRGADLRRVRRRSSPPRVKELRQGADDASYKQDVGAMTFPPQVEIVSDHVEDARAKGARILTGGRRKDGPGDWYEPTVIADADHSMKVMVDETFGPVLGVMKVRDADEAVRDGQRHPLRALGLGDVARHQARRGGRAPARGRGDQHRRRAHQLLPPQPADGRLEELGHRLPPRRLRDQARSAAPRRSSRRGSAQGKRDPLWFPHKRRERRLINGLFRFFNARGLRDRLGL